MTVDDLQKMLEATNAESGRVSTQYQIGTDYYYNNTQIARTGAAAIYEVNSYLKKFGKNPLKSADNKISTNWHRVLTDQKIGYLFTYPPQFDIKGLKEDGTVVEDITDCLGDRYEEIIRQLGTDASNGGIAWLMYWYDGKDSEFNYYFVEPMKIRAIYDETSVIPELKYIIHTYATTNEQNKSVTKYEVWSNKDVNVFIQPEGGSIALEKTKTHEYGSVPFIPFKNNAKCVDDLKMYKTLIDSMDKLVSGYANDIDDLQEIVWVIKNYNGEVEEIDYDVDGNPVKKEINLLQKLKTAKYIHVDENGGVDTIKGEIPHEARSKFLEILTEQLFISAMAVNPNPEKTGQASGVYIKFLYSLLELKSGIMETNFRHSLNEFVRAILRYLNITEKVKIEQKWTRNRPTNELEIVDMLSKTPNTVLSDETKTKEHPLVEDWQTERERIEAEQKLLIDNMFEVDSGGGAE